MRLKTWQSTEKDEKVTYRQYVTKLFNSKAFAFFSDQHTFEESLFNDDMYIFNWLLGAAKCNL